MAGPGKLLGRRQPAGPEPMTATRLPVFFDAGIGLIQPSAKPRSTIWYSMCRISTGSSLIASVQAVSQGAGQIRPVISGKLFV